jgi:hypothetical protein
LPSQEAGCTFYFYQQKILQTLYQRCLSQGQSAKVTESFSENLMKSTISELKKRQSSIVSRECKT